MITFEDRAVAFIDILGFTPLVNNSVNDEDSLDKLSRLVSLLEQAVPTLNAQVNKDVPQGLIPQHTYISDCIILSAPLRDDKHGYDFYDGLDLVCMRVIQLTHFFLNEGYLIRGGISVGKAWHTDSNIVGPAYQEAYGLEKSGNSPAVHLSESACKIIACSSRVRLKHDGKVFVNGLCDIYNPRRYEHGGNESTYAKYRLIIDEMINHGNLAPKDLKKWTWFKEYLEAEANLNQQWQAVYYGIDEIPEPELM